MKLVAIDNLIKDFSSLPGIGEKSAERLVYNLLNLDSNQRNRMASNIESLNNIKKCSICNSITDREKCSICEDKTKTGDVICIVDDVRNLILFEKNNIFNGKYFVLSNLISPVRGVDVSDLNLEQLDRMIEKYHTTELLLALKPSIEGETTALYLSKKYKDKVKVTKLAQGIPLNAEIEFLDNITLTQAFQDRKEL